MLAGRKLLLADDSITIQKVVNLTFADEGVSVVCVNNGREAIERLEEFAPDIVLADVFMPQMSGYEVCKYIKQNEKLKHIPVMLLVGSFEPFDEAEARRVGADDTLTKPFESIRRLIDKVGMLLSGRPEEEEIPTAELSKPEVVAPEPEKLTEKEIEITTADTQPLPPELGDVVAEAELSRLKKEGGQPTTDTKVDEQRMESKVTESHAQVSENYETAGDLLLDLGDFQPAGSSPGDDFVLDIDLDEVPEPSPVEPLFSAPAFVGRDRYKSVARDWKSTDEKTTTPGLESSGVAWLGSGVGSQNTATTADQLAKTQEFSRPIGEVKESAPEASAADVAVVEEQASRGGSDAIATEQKALEQLSPEVIDAIARRAVEQLSEKVVQEIAWEVVPQLAELMIKRQLEEKNS